jgi:hypothetical protein
MALGSLWAGGISEFTDMYATMEGTLKRFALPEL